MLCSGAGRARRGPAAAGTARAAPGPVEPHRGAGARRAGGGRVGRRPDRRRDRPAPRSGRCRCCSSWCSPRRRTPRPCSRSAPPGAAELCRALQAQLRLSGVGPALASVVPVLLLLVVAEGLRRGRRAALVVGDRAEPACSPRSACCSPCWSVSTPAEQLIVYRAAPGTRTDPRAGAAAAAAARGGRAAVVRPGTGSPCARPTGTYRRLWPPALGVLVAVSAAYVLRRRGRRRPVRPAAHRRRSCSPTCRCASCRPGTSARSSRTSCPRATSPRCCSSGPASCSGWSWPVACWLAFRRPARRPGRPRRGRGRAELVARGGVEPRLADDVGRATRTGSTPDGAAPRSPTA